MSNPAPLAAHCGPATVRHTPRLDLYQPIHKALRAFLSDTLVRLGALDVDDAGDRAAVLGQMLELLQLMAAHVMNENGFMHPAIEARQPGGSARIAEEHADHVATIDALAAEAHALQAQPTPERAPRLYRHFALALAENFEHMHFEETVHNAALRAHYDDAELQGLHGALLASLPAEEVELVLRWMVPALNPAQRAELMGALRSQLPPEPFRALLDAACAGLTQRDFAKLARALDLPLGA
jgi:hypothetical protein